MSHRAILENAFWLWSHIYLFDLLRYLIPASGAFLFFWAFRRHKWERRLIQGKWAPTRQLWTEFRYSMYTVVIFSIVGFSLYHGARAGIFKIYEGFSAHGPVYFVFSIVWIIVLHDMYFYWTHRAMHSKKLFKIFHRVHHLSINPSPWAAYSFAIPEAIVQALFLPLLTALLPVHGVVLFLFLANMILRNVLGHLSIEALPKGFLKTPILRIFTTTTHHNMHHQYFHCNYGLYFTWWDRLMNTTHQKYQETFETVASGCVCAREFKPPISGSLDSLIPSILSSRWKIRAVLKDRER